MASALGLYARTHHFVTYGVGTIALGALLPASLGSTRGFTSWVGYATTPLSMAVAAAMGVLVATTWTGRGGRQEDALLTREPTVARLVHPVALTVASVLVGALVTGVVQSSVVGALVIARAVLGWAALALLGAVVSSAYLAWSVPAVYFLAIGALGYQADGSARWWNAPMRPLGDPTPWVLIGVVVVAAAVAIRRRVR